MLYYVLESTLTNPLHNQPDPDNQDRAPLIGTWGRLYAAVLAHLAFWIVIFYFFTVRFDLP